MNPIVLDKFVLAERLAKINRSHRFVVISHFINGYDESLTNRKSDIDILCDNNSTKRKIVKLLGGIKIHKYVFSKSYWINYKNRRVPLDLFTSNDGFYPKKWCINMLNQRIFNDGLFFLSETDNKYTCLYHNFFHKEQIDSNSLNKINVLFKNDGGVESLYLNKLISFMDKNKYTFTATLDKRKINNLNYPEINVRFSYPFSIRMRHIFYYVFIAIPKRMCKLFIGQ